MSGALLNVLLHYITLHITCEAFDVTIAIDLQHCHRINKPQIIIIMALCNLFCKLFDTDTNSKVQLMERILPCF